jgi:hypothetical protein
VTYKVFCFSLKFSFSTDFGSNEHGINGAINFWREDLNTVESGIYIRFDFGSTDTETNKGLRKRIFSIILYN